MKWKNYQQPNAAYFITTTSRNFIPLFNNCEVREIVYSSLKFLKGKYRYKIVGYCLVPDHIHLMIQAEGDLDVSRVMADFKRFTAHEIYNNFKKNKDNYWLKILENSAYKGQGFSVWQETFRSEVVYEDKFLQKQLNYIHNNPVRRGLVKNAVDWPHSSAAFYYLDRSGNLEVEV
jgi:REP element-mobilizing transposase RayT